MAHLSKKDYIKPFDENEFSGELYQLDEPVLDIKSVTETLREQFSNVIFQRSIEIINSVQSADEPVQYQLKLSNTDTLNAQTIIFCAGAGNEKLLQMLNFKQPQMQRRPLFMPMLKAKDTILPALYAHCLGAQALPKMTITSHLLNNTDSKDTEIVWYLGGEIAETGVPYSLEQQIQRAKQELNKLMPWLDFSLCQWSALRIDRAEPKMPDGSRPVEPAVFLEQQVITAWPVKLAMTPLMVDKIITKLERLKITKNSQSLSLNSEKDIQSAALVFAKTSQLPWEKVTQWL